MKKLSKILAVVLSLIMIISAIPFTASAGTVTGTCGENLTWTFDDSTGTLTISGTGAMYDYDYNNRPWETYEDSIKKAIIEDGVTTIGDCAFYECTSLTSITIPDSVTTISNGAFHNCNSLESVTIPDSVTSIGIAAFYNCYSLTSVTIPDSVTSIGYDAFHNCTSLESVTIPDSVTSIGELPFVGCSNLKSIFVDSNNQYYSSDENGVLFNKDKSTLIQFPSGNESYTIPDSVTTIGYCAFYECTNLTSVTIPDSVTTISNGAFYNCTSLESVTIGDNVTTIGYDAFSSCTSLESVTIPDSVTSIGDYAFCYCDSLTRITVNSNNKCYSSDEHGVLFNKDKTTLIQYPIGNTRINYTIPDNVVSIGVGAFESCTSLTNVTIPDSVITIDGYAFVGCESIVSITIPNSVTTIGVKSFAHCYGLEVIYIGSNITTIERGAFLYIVNLTDVYYNGSEEEWRKINILLDNENLLNANIHFVSCEHTFGDWLMIESSTCTKDGLGSRVCSKCEREETQIIPATGHQYTVVTIPPTCTEDGYETFTCECGDSYVKFFEKAKGHTPAKVVSENRVAPTCIENGSKDFVVYCSICGEEISRETVVLEARGHINTDNDGCCDDCGELIEPIIECDHSCHRGGFAGFFWKIINFFSRLLGLNKYCECGAAHY